MRTQIIPIQPDTNRFTAALTQPHQTDENRGFHRACLCTLTALFVMLLTGCDGDAGSRADASGDTGSELEETSDSTADSAADSATDSTADSAADSAADFEDSGSDHMDVTDIPDTADVDGLCSLVTGFDKECLDHGACIIGYHQVDCCGTHFAIGMVQTERERFDQLEAVCVTTYPACGCPSGPTGAEDGRSGNAITVRCIEEQCTTLVIDDACDVVDEGYDKTCVGDDDCAIGIHQIDCCGSMAAIGMNIAELPRFEGEEFLCRESLPICDCPAMSTEAEDGRSTPDNEQIFVHCVQEQCYSYVP